MEYLKGELEVAKEISGLQTPNLLVYGGGDEIRKFCIDNSLVYVQDFINDKSSKKMAKTSGSNGGLPNGDSNYKGKVGKLEPLASIKNPKVYKTVKESISRFHSVLGVRQKDIKIGQLEAGTGGVHISQNGVSKQVVLNKSVFNGKNTTTQSVAKWAEKVTKADT